MGLNPELVHEAEVARERLAVAQHAAEQARADYHLAIRRLHAAGGSLREIAEALRLCHQRVHQIIEEAAKPTRCGVGAVRFCTGRRGRAHSAAACTRSAPS
jgi:hypothetical protein